MKSVHTVSSIDMEASGPSYTVPRLALALVTHGQAAELVTLGVASNETDKGVRIVHCPQDHSRPRLISKLGRSRAMHKALLASSADIFHTHGLWMMPNVYPADAARRLGKPLVLAPRGMLGRDALQFSAWAKHVFWAVWQKHAVEAVACFHATAESEYNDIRAYGLSQPVAIIPNGIDLPDLAWLAATSSNTQKASARSILSLGRIHPKKGLDRLVAAFARVADDHPRWRLRIVGPDEGGHASELARQIAVLGLGDRVSLEPPVFGLDKLLMMRAADVFALATRHENFGMTVAESLAVETPVICTRGAPWAGLVEHGCGWWVDHGPEAMATALRDAMAMPRYARREMGARGRLWMQRDFGWDGIAAQMVDVYRWLIEGGERPASVRVE